jgi:RimJ/RimL family protein N-acetyltransferase
MPIDEIAIRAPRLSDAKAMIAYMHRLTGEDNNNITLDPGQFQCTEEQERKWIGSRGDTTQCLLLLAELQGRIIAIARLERHSAPTAAHAATLGISIDRDYRGQGLGTKLMGLLLKWAYEERIRRVELKVFARNAVALKLYRKFGFVEEGRHRLAACKQGQFIDDITMALILE